MITEIPTAELVAIGARLPADYLVEQAGYTLEHASQDGKPLEDLLPDGYLNEVKGARDAVVAGMRDRALMAAEAKEAANQHHKNYKLAKVYRRKVSRRALRAKRMGKPVPDELIRIDQTHTGPGLVAQVIRMVSLLEANLPAMSGKGSDELLAEGKDLAQSLQDVDARHEAARLAGLPEAVQRFYLQKGLLYIGLKVIHDAGHELHAGDHGGASRYNMGILYRNKRHAKPAPAPQPA